MPNAFTLTTQADTWSPSGGAKRRKVTVEFRGQRPVLKIEDTPGQWGDLVSEALARVLGEDPSR